MKKHIEVLRLYADDDGESRFDSVDIPMALKDFAPPAEPLYVSEPQATSRYVHIQLPAGWDGERHPSPRRQILFCLAGAMDVIASGGETRSVAAGDAWLMADTHGKGHVTRVTSEGPVTAVIVQLE